MPQAFDRRRLVTPDARETTSVSPLNRPPLDPDAAQSMVERLYTPDLIRQRRTRAQMQENHDRRKDYDATADHHLANFWARQRHVKTSVRCFSKNVPSRRALTPAAVVHTTVLGEDQERLPLIRQAPAPLSPGRVGQEADDDSTGSSDAIMIPTHSNADAASPARANDASPGKSSFGTRSSYSGRSSSRGSITPTSSLASPEASPQRRKRDDQDDAASPAEEHQPSDDDDGANSYEDDDYDDDFESPVASPTKSSTAGSPSRSRKVTDKAASPNEHSDAAAASEHGHSKRSEAQPDDSRAVEVVDEDDANNTSVAHSRSSAGQSSVPPPVLSESEAAVLCMLVAPAQAFAASVRRLRLHDGIDLTWIAKHGVPPKNVTLLNIPLDPSGDGAEEGKGTAGGEDASATQQQDAAGEDQERLQEQPHTPTRADHVLQQLRDSTHSSDALERLTAFVGDYKAAAAEASPADEATTEGDTAAPKDAADAKEESSTETKSPTAASDCPRDDAAGEATTAEKSSNSPATSSPRPESGDDKEGGEAGNDDAAPAVDGTAEAQTVPDASPSSANAEARQLIETVYPDVAAAEGGSPAAKVEASQERRRLLLARARDALGAADAAVLDAVGFACDSTLKEQQERAAKEDPSIEDQPASSTEPATAEETKPAADDKKTKKPPAAASSSPMANPSITSPRSAHVLLRNGVSAGELWPVSQADFFRANAHDGVARVVLKHRHEQAEASRLSTLQRLRDEYAALCGSVTSAEVMQLIEGHRDDGMRHNPAVSLPRPQAATNKKAAPSPYATPQRLHSSQGSRPGSASSRVTNASAVAAPRGVLSRGELHQLRQQRLRDQFARMERIEHTKTQGMLDQHRRELAHEAALRQKREAEARDRREKAERRDHRILKTRQAAAELDEKLLLDNESAMAFTEARSDYAVQRNAVEKLADREYHRTVRKERERAVKAHDRQLEFQKLCVLQAAQQREAHINTLVHERNLQQKRMAEERRRQAMELQQAAEKNKQDLLRVKRAGLLTDAAEPSAAANKTTASQPRRRAKSSMN